MRTSDLIALEEAEHAPAPLDLRGWTDDDIGALAEAATDENGRIWDHTSLYTVDTVATAYAFFVLRLKFQMIDVAGFRQVFIPAEIPPGVSPLEFDRKPSYRQLGIASALETMLIYSGLAEPDPTEKKVLSCDIPGMMELVRIMGKNNGTGYLKKKLIWPLAHLLRKTPRIQVGDTGFEESMGYWLGRYLAIIDVFLAYHQEGLKPEDLDVEGFKGAHPDKARALSVGPRIRKWTESLFDLGGYLVALFTLGYTKEDIDREFDFFFRSFQEMEEMRKEDEAEADRIFAELKDGRGPHRYAQMPWGQVLLVHTPEKDVTGFLIDQLDESVKLVIARAPDGHAAFLTRRHSRLWMRSLEQRLLEKEPGLWLLMKYGDGVFLLMNAGDKRRYDIEPTRFTDDELLYFVEQNVRPAKRK